MFSLDLSWSMPADLLTRLLGAHARRSHQHGEDVLHVEIGRCDDEQLEELERRLIELEGITQVYVDGPRGRARLRFDAQRWEAGELREALGQLEDEIGAGRVERDGSFAADLEPRWQALSRGLIDLGAALVGSSLRVVGGPIRPLSTLASLISIARNSPPVRERLEEALGEELVGLGTGGLRAVLKGLSAEPVSPLIDLLKQVIRWRGRRDQDELFARLEDDLLGELEGRRPTSRRRQRPEPPPADEVDEYGETAWWTSIGGFMVALAETRELELSLTPLFSGLPKAARYGKEAFLARLGSLFAERDIQILHDGALELLVRVDAVIVDSDALLGERVAITSLEPLTQKEEGDEDLEPILCALGRLFDGSVLDEPREDGEGWRLAPAHSLEGALDVELEGAQALLTQDGAPRARLRLRRELRRGARELLEAARDVGVDWAVAGDDELEATVEPPQRLPGDPEELAGTIAEAQRRDRVVLWVGGPCEAAAEAADVSVVLRGRGDPSLYAATFAVPELIDAAIVVQACERSHQLVDQAVSLATAGAAIASCFSLRGLKRSQTAKARRAVDGAGLLSILHGVVSVHRFAEDLPQVLMDPTPWHALSTEEALERLEVDHEGLSAQEASARQREEAPEPGPARRYGQAVLTELDNPFTPLLAAGAVVSSVVGSAGDAIMVVTVIGLGGLIGGFERFQAEEAVEDLTKRAQRQVLARRDGGWTEVDIEELVVGDVIRVAHGDTVPADARILEAHELEVDESSLTGESLPVAKRALPSFAAAPAERHSMLYASSAIVAGEVEAVVVATGARTEARRAMSAGVQRRDRAVGVAERLDEIGELTIPASSASAALLLLGGLMRGRPLMELLEAGVGLAVASVPEGLPLLSTIAELAAARRLAERGIIARHNEAIEALGRVDIVCADKTGTLTEGELHLRGAALVGQEHRDLEGAERPPSKAEGEEGGGEDRADALDELLRHALRASPKPESADAHQTDLAVVEGGERLGLEVFEGEAERVDELVFSSGRSYHATKWRGPDGELHLSVKGSPERLAELADVQDPSALLEQAGELAGRGLRVLAVGRRALDGRGDGELAEDDVGSLEVLGFLTLADPARPASGEALEKLAEAGVETIMITGDHPATATRIAAQLGMEVEDEEASLTGRELDEMSDEALQERLPRVRLVARATPTHKTRIVEALQRAGHIVAMTGDGSNDAAAIRLADVGIALGEGATDSAREAADLVLLESDLASIAMAIGEGRGLWDAVRDAVGVLVGGNLGEIAYTVFGSVFLPSAALNARQLLLVNLLTDVAPALAIAVRPPPEGDLERLLAQGPDEALGAALDRDLVWRAAVTSTAAATAGGIATALPGGDGRGASTTAMLALIGSQLGQTLTSGRPTGPTLAASLGSAAAMLALVETPGLSGLVGCRPLGPVGLSIAAGTSVGAAALAPLGRGLIDRVWA